MLLYRLQSTYRVIGSNKDDSPGSRGDKFGTFANRRSKAELWGSAKPHWFYAEHRKSHSKQQSLSITVRRIQHLDLLVIEIPICRCVKQDVQPQTNYLPGNR